MAFAGLRLRGAPRFGRRVRP